MVSAEEKSSSELQYAASEILHKLGVPVHRIGYKQLRLAIALFAQNDTQFITKELYPHIAAHFGYADWRPVEHAIRLTICCAWNHRDPEVWKEYFPGAATAPSNKLFIAAIADLL